MFKFPKLILRVILEVNGWYFIFISI